MSKKLSWLVAMIFVLNLFMGSVAVFSADSAADTSLQVTFTANAANGNHFWAVSKEPYVFQAGDYIEYDVYLNDQLPGLGGIEVYCTGEGGPQFRGSGDATYVDQDGLSGIPNTDISSKAYKKWYHRKLPVPANRVGMTVRDFCISIDKSGNEVGAKYVVLYDNYVVTNGGKVVHTVYQTGAPIIDKKVSPENNVAYDVKLEVIPAPAGVPAPIGGGSTVPSTTPSPTPAGSADDKMLQLEITTNATNGNYFWAVSKDPYVLEEGDCIEYDVYLNDKLPGIGAIEVYTTETGGPQFRDSGDATYVDQDGLSGHPKTDLSEKAYKKWYHRKLPVPANRVGMTVRDFCVGVDNASHEAGAKYVVYYDNYVVTNGGKVVKVVYQTGDPKSNVKVSGGSNVAYDFKISPVAAIEGVPAPLPTATPGPSGTPKPTATPKPTPVPLVANATGDVIKLTAVSADLSSPSKWAYWIISKDQYKFQEGDYIEYDVYVETELGGIGSLEVVLEDNTFFRDQSAEYRDQNSLSGHPGTNISTQALNKWYHRKMPVPKTGIGKSSNFWTFGVENAQANRTHIVYYDNITVTNNNKVVKTIYAEGTPSASEAGEANTPTDFKITVEIVKNPTDPTPTPTPIPPTELKLKIDSKSMTVTKGTSITTVELDAEPVISNDRTFLPIRAVVEALNGKISWIAPESRADIILGETRISIWVGDNTATINGKEVQIDAANANVKPFILNSRTMLPLRFVSENLGAKVEWDGKTQGITITYQP